jgi:parallel beta-helix repeat protein
VVGIGIGLLTWSLLASGLASAQVISISSCPVVISQPGSYIVTQDLTCPTPAVAITINASSVVLNLGGHRVSGGMSHGIAVGAVSGVTILNGTIAGFGGDGLVLESTNQSLVSRMTVTSNGGIGIVADKANSNEITQTAISNNAYGIVLSNSASANAVITNTVTSSANGGIILYNGANNNLIWLNTLTGNGGFGGIVVANSTSNLISSNTATGNAPVDLFDSSATCDANLWASNAFVSANPPSCIH